MKIDQTRLDQELDFILGQQRELEDMLLPLEQSLTELSSVSTYQQHADIDREHTYVSLSLCVSLCVSVYVWGTKLWGSAYTRVMPHSHT